MTGAAEQEVIDRFNECLSERTPHGFAQMVASSITRQDLKLAIEALARPRPVETQFVDADGTALYLNDIVRYELTGRHGVVVALGTSEDDSIIRVRFTRENVARKIHPGRVRLVK